MDLKELDKSGKGEPEHHPWEIARFKVVSFILKKKFKKENGLFFDIGCGDTYFLENLKSLYPDSSFTGVDIAFSDELLKQLNSKFNGSIQLYKQLNDIDNSKGGADIVFLLDVIEHIESDEEFLVQILNSELFSEGTLIFITVPAFQSLFCSHDQFLGHYRRYTLKMLVKLAKSLNLEIVDKRYFFSYLIIFRWIRVILEKIKKPNMEDVKGIGGWKKRNVIDTILVNTLLMDFHLTNLLKKIGITIPGLSCSIILRKQQ